MGGCDIGLTLVGCVDKDYDLGEVDMTIGTGGNLSLPSNNSTENVCLDDVLDLAEPVLTMEASSLRMSSTFQPG